MICLVVIVFLVFYAYGKTSLARKFPARASGLLQLQGTLFWQRQQPEVHSHLGEGCADTVSLLDGNLFPISPGLSPG